MAWLPYKGLHVADPTTGQGGTYLSENFMALADRTSGTEGSVLFVDASGFATEDNANFFFDDSNVRLGLGTDSPDTSLEINSSAPAILLKDSTGRTLQITGPTGSNASIALGDTGANLIFSTPAGVGGGFVFRGRNVDRISVGNGTVATLGVNGGIATGVVTKSSAYTLTFDDSVVRADASGGAFTLTLPDAATRSGIRYSLKKIDSSGNAVTIATTSSQTIDGSSTKSLSAQHDRIEVVSDGANWMVF